MENFELSEYFFKALSSQLELTVLGNDSGANREHAKWATNMTAMFPSPEKKKEGARFVAGNLLPACASVQPLAL